MTQDIETTYGHLVLIGAPNAGKSTLLNKLVGQKVSIVSHKKQTTRCRISGIVSDVEQGHQIVVIDTPGLCATHNRLESAMMATTAEAVGAADVVGLVYDASRPLNNDAWAIVAPVLAEAKCPVLLLVNQIDRVSKPHLLGLVQELATRYKFADVLMISALKGQGVDDIWRYVTPHLHPSPWAYDADQLSELPTRLLVAELTREQIFQQLGAELPYATTVETETFTQEEKRVYIQQTLYVRKDSQKAIVIGKGGQRLKQIGMRARYDMIELLGQPVHLELFVKVREDWQNDPDRYLPWGLAFGGK